MGGVWYGCGMDFETLKAGITRPSSTVDLCLRSDLFAARQRTLGELSRVMRDEDTLAGSKAHSDAEVEIMGRLRDLDAKMREATTTFTFTAMPRSAFTALEDVYPFHDDTPSPAFLVELLAASMSDPELTTAQAGELLELLSDGQAQVLEDAAWAVNRETGSLDF